MTTPRRSVLRRLFSSSHDPVTSLKLALVFQLVVFVLVLVGEPYDAAAPGFIGGTAGLLLKAAHQTRRPSTG